MFLDRSLVTTENQDCRKRKEHELGQRHTEDQIARLRIGPEGPGGNHAAGEGR